MINRYSTPERTGPFSLFDQSNDGPLAGNAEHDDCDKVEGPERWDGIVFGESVTCLFSRLR